jgi:hypothetical protein
MLHERARWRLRHNTDVERVSDVRSWTNSFQATGFGSAKVVERSRAASISGCQGTPLWAGKWVACSDHVRDRTHPHYGPTISEENILLRAVVPRQSLETASWGVRFVRHSCHGSGTAARQKMTHSGHHRHTTAACHAACYDEKYFLTCINARHSRHSICV